MSLWQHDRDGRPSMAPSRCSVTHRRLTAPGSPTRPSACRVSRGVSCSWSVHPYPATRTSPGIWPGIWAQHGHCTATARSSSAAPWRDCRMATRSLQAVAKRYGSSEARPARSAARRTPRWPDPRPAGQVQAQPGEGEPHERGRGPHTARPARGGPLDLVVHPLLRHSDALQISPCPPPLKSAVLWREQTLHFVPLDRIPVTGLLVGGWTRRHGPARRLRYRSGPHPHAPGGFRPWALNGNVVAHRRTVPDQTPAKPTTH